MANQVESTRMMVKRLKYRNVFGIFLIKKTKMINEKKEMYKEDAMNQLNTFELLLKIKNLIWAMEMGFRIGKYKNMDEKIEKIEKIDGK